MSTLRLLLATVALIVAIPAGSALAAPVNDDRDAPTPVSPNGQVINGSTTGATVNQKDHEAPGTGTHSVWFSWTAPQNGLVTITSASFTFNPVLAVYTDGNDCCPWREDHDSGSGDDAMTSFYVRAGQHYEILVDGETAADYGSYTLTVAFDSTPPAPGNDDFADAEDLGTGKTASRNTNGLFATDETFEPNHRGVATSHSVWFKWTPSQSGGARVKADCKYGPSDNYGTDDAIVAVYTGFLLSSLTQVPYTDTEWPNDCTREYVQFYATAGVTYRIAVDAGAGAIGDTPMWLNQDTTVPTASFDANSVYGPNQTIKFTTSESTHVQCKLDGGAIFNCSSEEVKLTNASAGNHKLEVRPTDYYGNAGVWHTKSFTVETTPPQTQITGSPAALVNKSDQTITFASEAGATFQCRYPTMQWFACNGGSYLYKYYYGKTDDVTFEVRAVDVHGNVDPTPSGASWKYDFAAPKITFPYNTPVVQAPNPMTFTWTVDEKATTECSVDGGPFGPCSSPLTIPGQATAGNRTIKVRATDLAGNTNERQYSGYQSSPKTTTPTTKTTSTTTTQPVRQTTYPVNTQRSRSVIALLPAKRSITRKALAAKGLRFSASCQPGCAMRVQLVAGRTILASKTVRGGGTLKLGTKAKKALKKVKRGTSLTLVAQGPGVVQRSRIRVTG